MALLLLVLMYYHDPPDLIQDYAAAWGVLHHYDPNDSTATLSAACCPQVESSAGRVYPTAHPPAATLLVMPLALFSWRLAQWLWLFVSLTAIFGSWYLLQPDVATLIVMLPVWFIMVVNGTLEPVLLVLLVLTLRWREWPYLAGVCLGVATDLKVYPAFFLLGLVWAGAYRTALAALVVVGLVMGSAELIVGGTAKWLTYTPVNLWNQVSPPYNLSLVHIAHRVLPTVPPLVLSAGIMLGLLVPILRRLRTDPFSLNFS